MSVRQLLRDKGSEVATLKASAKLQDAIGLLSRDDTSVVVVVDELEGIRGLLSSSDLATQLHHHSVLDRQRPIDQIMTRKVITADIAASVQQVEELMLKHHIRHVPITNNGKLCGLVGVLDVMAYRLRNAESEASQLRGYVASAGAW